jgi:hypothetical protein
VKNFSAAGGSGNHLYPVGQTPPNFQTIAWILIQTKTNGRFFPGIKPDNRRCQMPAHRKNSIRLHAGKSAQRRRKTETK